MRSLRILIPGLLVAATGVGAGDLITASLAGGFVGLGIVFVPLLGALLKLTLNEGLARYQLFSGRTLIEGWASEIGGWIKPVFLVYLLIWSFVVGGALMNACGVAGHALFPLSDDLDHSRAFWGILHSLGALLLLACGTFRLFSILMTVAIGAVFLLAFVVLIPLFPSWEEWRAGFAALSFGNREIDWTLAVFGGVGGTVTILSYGYWLRENREEGPGAVRSCRIDLATSYTLIGLFSVALLIIGHQVGLAEEKSSLLPLVLAEAIGERLGEGFRWLFLIGFWCAVFSSLLGVWQGVPYLFSDTLKTFGWADAKTERRSYRIFQVGLATLPALTFFTTFRSVQLVYAISGALFMPFLAATLLYLNNRRGRPGQNGWLTNSLLILTLVVFAVLGLLKLLPG